jgi:hypothetical protein
MLIKLLDSDLEYAKQVAAKRNNSQRNAHRGDGVVMASSIYADVIGAEGELAVSKGLGLPWDGEWLPIESWDTWKLDGHDVGQIEVRSTKHASGRLILHPNDKDFSPYVLVISTNSPEFRLAGWCFGNEGKKSSYWRTNVPKPCYMVPQERLYPMADLIKILKK